LFSSFIHSGFYHSFS